LNLFHCEAPGAPLHGGLRTVKLITWDVMNKKKYCEHMEKWRHVLILRLKFDRFFPHLKKYQLNAIFNHDRKEKVGTVTTSCRPIQILRKLV